MPATYHRIAELKCGLSATLSNHHEDRHCRINDDIDRRGNLNLSRTPSPSTRGPPPKFVPLDFFRRSITASLPDSHQATRSESGQIQQLYSPKDSPEAKMHPHILVSDRISK